MSTISDLQNLLENPALGTALRVLDQTTRDNGRMTLTGMEMTALTVLVDCGLHAVRLAPLLADDLK